MGLIEEIKDILETLVICNFPDNMNQQTYNKLIEQIENLGE